jgi:hypothetical protein
MRVESTRGTFGGGSTAQTQRSGSIGARACGVSYYLNGTHFPITPDMTINQFVDPEIVEGIEVYTGTSQIPPEFNSSVLSSRCGVVVIWTRSGIDKSVSR